jgi:hypothetical protein
MSTDHENELASGASRNVEDSANFGVGQVRFDSARVPRVATFFVLYPSTFAVMRLRLPRPAGWRGVLRMSAGQGEVP